MNACQCLAQFLLLHSPGSQPRDDATGRTFHLNQCNQIIPQACLESCLPRSSHFHQDDNYITPTLLDLLSFLQCWSHSFHPLCESSHLGTKSFCIDFRALLISHWKWSQEVEQEEKMAGRADKGLHAPPSPEMTASSPFMLSYEISYF